MSEDTSAEDTSNEDESTEDTSNEDESAEDTSSEDESAEDTSSQDDGNGEAEAGPSRHEPGTPAWAELGTTDAQSAAAFYAGLFGWQAENTPAGAAGTYVLLQKEGKDVAALYEQDEAMRSRGVPPLWLVYFSVDDVSAAAAKAQEAGGTVHAQPFDVAQAGRMALVQDPTGAMFALWQAGSRAGAEVLHEPGTLDWFELATNDPEKAGEFYEQVLGWSVNAEEFDGTPYTTCLLGEQPVAGILAAEALGEDVAPNWGVYFAVEDCAATVEKAQSSGGELVFGPQDMPRVGQFAGLRDPQGAAFAIIQPTSADDGEDDDDESGDDSDKSEGDSSEEQSGDQKSGESDKSDHAQEDDASGKGDEDKPDDADKDGESDEKGEPNEEMREKKKDSGGMQADGEPDDEGVR